LGVEAIGAKFEIPKRFVEAVPYGSGHIHDTYLARYEDSQQSARFILQRINSQVFRDPPALMDNLSRVCAHQLRALIREGVPDPERRCLALVPARDGRPYWTDADGDYWRCFPFQEGTRSFDRVETEHQAHETARAFGAFAARLLDLDGPRLAITIPQFHDLVHRYAALETATRRDRNDCARNASAEIDQAADWFDTLEREVREFGGPELPVRTFHNDCKINNVLLDADSGEGLCVIDLDTVMDSTVLCDFGELVRTSTCRSVEDETQLNAVSFELDLLRGVARGYLKGAGSFLTPAELRILPIAGMVMAFENAIRFLTDHLCGDLYFKIHRAGHNLDRARTQLRLVELLDENRDAIRAVLTTAQAEILTRSGTSPR
jgi:Ser/Thr protein kinase RdoA (MazF antagonist)